MTIRALAAAAAVLLTSAASAAESKTASDIEKGLKGAGAYGTAGCGLGSMAFGSQPGGIQIIAATTNALFGTQTFGITTGTSNCGPGLFAMGTKSFVEANREAVAKDVSRGQGEAIGALAVINRCPDARAVGAALQRNFAAIFPSEQASSDEVTKAILETLRADPALGCANG